MEPLNKVVMSVGQTVPDFELETYLPSESRFDKISLGGLKAEQKWAVLVFYPADFTFVCPTELADLACHYETLRQLKAELIAISTDTKFAHLAWRNSEKLLENVQYPMAADPTGFVSRLFGVYDGATGLALRGTFIIDPSGKLVASEVNYYNLGRDAGELIRKVKAFSYLRDHPEEACPAGWSPGSQTLTPSEKMVGNVYGALNAPR